jgi:hypothetical protein
LVYMNKGNVICRGNSLSGVRSVHLSINGKLSRYVMARKIIVSNVYMSEYCEIVLAVFVLMSVSFVLIGLFVSFVFVMYDRYGVI